MDGEMSDQIQLSITIVVTCDRHTDLFYYDIPMDFTLPTI